MSIEEFARITPVNPPIVNKNTNPKDHSIEGEKIRGVPWRLTNQLKILIPVGIAMAEVK